MSTIREPSHVSSSNISSGHFRAFSEGAGRRATAAGAAPQTSRPEELFPKQADPQEISQEEQSSLKEQSSNPYIAAPTSSVHTSSQGRLQGSESQVSIRRDGAF